MLNNASIQSSTIDSSLFIQQPTPLPRIDSAIGADATDSRALVFVDTRVANYQSLVADANAEVILIDGDSSGLAQISEALAGREDLSALHVISHGGEGDLLLGQGSVDGDDLEAYSREIMGWASALDEGADILLYGCNVAGSVEGIEFVQRLGELSGADVAASDGLTGVDALGGDWDLEVATGAIEAASFIALEFDSVLATFQVTNTSDSGAGSLRQAILDANSNGDTTDVITFDPTAFTGGGTTTITLTSGELSISEGVTIDGDVDGDDQADVAVNGNNSSRVFNVSSSSEVTLDSLNITSGDSAGQGGGVYNTSPLTISNSTVSGNSARYGGGVHNTSSLTISNSTVSGNSARYGGGIFNTGTLTVTTSTVSGNSATYGDGGGTNNSGTLIISNSTVSGNSAGFTGGGVFNYNTLTIENSTVSGNSAIYDGGGVNNFYYGTLTITNSTVSGNSAGNYGNGIHNTGIVNASNNILGQSGNSDVSGFTPGTDNITPSQALDTILETDTNGKPLLKNNGGLTETISLVNNSPAIDAASSSINTTDQRGFDRNGLADIGAFEFGGTPPATNQDPVLTFSSTATYTESAPSPTLLDPNATLTDDSADFNNGQLTVTLTAGAEATDSLAINNQGTGTGQIGISGSNITFEGTTIGSFSGGNGTAPLVITLNTSATPANTQALLQNLTYSSSSETLLDTDERTITIVLTDGDGGTSNTISQTIDITGQNDPANITGTTTGTATENSNSDVTGNLDFTDVDNPNDSWTSVINLTTFYGSFNISSDGQWRYALDEGNSTVDALNVGDNLSENVTTTTNDGTSQVVNITINGANDAAVITGDTTGVATENSNSTTDASGDLDFTDVDNPDNIWVAGSGNTTYGSFTLGTDGQWSYDLDETNPTVNALNASQSLTDSFVATTDGDGTTQTVNLTLNGANDAPVMTLDATATVLENEAGIDIANLSIADPDNGDSHSYRFELDGQVDNRFEVVSGKLKLKAGEILNHEKENNITLVVTVTDSGTPQLSDTESIDITVLDNLATLDILVVDESSDRDIRNNFRNLTLREAIALAHSGDTIRFTNPTTIALSEGELQISDDITIDGDINGDNQADITISRDNAAVNARLFTIQEGTTARFDSLNLTNGQTNRFESGGAIFNAGTLEINDSTLSNNQTGTQAGGGAIANTGTLTVNNSTFHNNSAGESGGAILNSTGPNQDKPGIVNLNNSTISSNSAVNNGGGLSSARGTMTITDSTITANQLTGNRRRFDGGEGIHSAGTLVITNSIISGNGEDDSLNREIYLALGGATLTHSLLGYNNDSGLVSVNGSNGFTLNGTNTVPGTGIDRADVLNRTLANNGGTTQTHALLATSPAVNAGSTSNLTDQRGSNRDANPDIGAFELPGSPATPLPPSLPRSPITATLDSRPNRSEVV